MPVNIDHVKVNAVNPTATKKFSTLRILKYLCFARNPHIDSGGLSRLFHATRHSLRDSLYSALANRKRARWDLNPGSPAPQASVLIQTRCATPKTQGADTLTRLRAHTQGIPHEGLIISTLIKMKNSGLSDNTITTVSHKLNQLAKNANLLNPCEVATYIANTKICNASKQKLAETYDYFAKANKLTWEKPRYRYERKIPLIPTTENIHKIISACSKKYATIYTILEETGLETQELATTQRKDVDAEQGIINVQGCKGHNSRSLKLTPKTAILLRTYLHEYTTANPFPISRQMGETWRSTRNELAKKLNQPQLQAIPLRNLRRHYTTKTYDRTKDILL